MTKPWSDDKRLLIFDLDGTLIDSFQDIAMSVNAMLTELGLPTLELTTIQQYIGAGARFLLSNSLREAGAEPDKRLEEAREVFVQCYKRNLANHTCFFEGAEDFLDRALQEGMTLALCTNKPLQFTNPLLEHLETSERFSIVLGGDSLPTRKPDPAPLLHILQTLKILPEQAVMVGDSIYDVMAAKNAGVEVWGVVTGHHSAEELQAKGADRVFRHIRDFWPSRPPAMV